MHLTQSETLQHQATCIKALHILTTEIQYNKLRLYNHVFKKIKKLTGAKMYTLWHLERIL